MRVHSRTSLSLLVSACLTIAFHVNAQEHDHAEGQAQDATVSTVKGGAWSDASIWSGGTVPKAGDVVTIAEGTDIILDVSPPALDGMNLNGKLSFADDQDLELTTEWVLMRGELHAGSETKPHTRNATITLTDNNPGENILGMGDRGIMIVGGVLSLHGDRENSWTKLSKTAEAGSTSIEVLDASGWRVGDQIVLASTDFNPRQAETRRVERVRGNTLTLDAPLQYMHFGEITFGVDERGEVGLLNRNIKVQASADADESYFGGHIMAMAGSKMNVAGIELTRMGQHLTLARYPIHWHLNGDVTGQYIKNSAIHDTFNRCVTIHGSDNLLVENNVTYNTVGHCFFMEDGVETGNQIVRNLGIQTKCHPTLACDPTNLAPGRPVSNGQKSEHVLLPSDNTASTFWITNPDNSYRDNVAAGSDQIGFWFALPVHPIGAFEGTERSANTWPRRTNVREFSGNSAHSNFDGFMFDRGPNPDNTFSVAGSNYHVSYADPADTNSEMLVSHFENFTAYKNRNGGVWGRGELHLFSNLKVADNAIGYTHAASAVGRTEYTSKVIDGIFVGESDNIGNPSTPQEIAYGRSLPTDMPDFPIRGYEYYDMRHDVVDTTFINFEPNDTRDAGALSYLMYTSFGMSTNNAIEGAKFVNAKPVSFPPTVRRWGSDLGRGNAWRGAAIHDRDGSVSGVPNAFIVLDNGIASDEDACQIKPQWGAAVCEGDYGHFGLGTSMGFDSGPIADPIMLSRNGRRWEYTGNTTIRSGAEVRVETSRDVLTLSLAEMERGGSVIFELPGFAASAIGATQTSLSALKSAEVTSYFKDEDTLWVKVVVADGGSTAVSAGPGAPAEGSRIEVRR